MDISLAALLGKGVYNFGELLLHPIVSVRQSLLSMVCAVNASRLHSELLQHRSDVTLVSTPCSTDATVSEIVQSVSQTSAFRSCTSPRLMHFRHLFR